MGSLVKDPKVHYQGGKVHVFHGLDPDNWSYFEALGLLKDLCHVDRVKMWWKEKGANFQNLKNYVMMRMLWNCLVMQLEEKLKLKYMLNTVLRSVKHQCSYQMQMLSCLLTMIMQKMQGKRKRDLGIKGGFNLRDVGQAEEALNEIVENMKNQSDGANTNTESPIDRGEGSANVESFVPADVVVMHEIEEEYVSDELDSGVEDGSDDNGRPRGKAKPQLKQVHSRELNNQDLQMLKIRQISTWGKGKATAETTTQQGSQQSGPSNARNKGKGKATTETTTQQGTQQSGPSNARNKGKGKATAETTTQSQRGTQQSRPSNARSKGKGKKTAEITTQQSQHTSQHLTSSNARNKGIAIPENSTQQTHVGVKTRKRKASALAETSKQGESSNAQNKKIAQFVGQKQADLPFPKPVMQKQADLPHIPAWAQNKTVAELVGHLVQQIDVWRETTGFGEQAQDDDDGDKAAEEEPNEEGKPVSLGSPQPNHELDN
ncbi:hypothetical protein SESBI_12001 [Sesbania bispinosa]|nr:hypothetical protein SESBI_12001 [Sesbania bispinosa]